MYELDKIQLHLESLYGINVSKVEYPNKGLDNTVIFIYQEGQRNPNYVLKIIESKSEEEIMSSISQSKIFGEHSGVKYLQTSTGLFLPTLEGTEKKAILYPYVDGAEISVDNDTQVKDVAKFIGSFHKKHISEDASMYDYFDAELDQIKVYLSSKDFAEGVMENFPEKFEHFTETYKYFENNLEEIKNILNLLNFSKGICHGDFNPGNLIFTKDGYKLIDLDTASINNFQIEDLMQFLAKSNFSERDDMLETFLEAYFKEKYNCETDVNKTLVQGIHLLMSVFSLRAEMSTFYYTYHIRKHTTEWIRKNALEKLDYLTHKAKLSIFKYSSSKNILKKSQLQKNMFRRL